MPDTTWPVSGHPPGSSRSRRNTPVPMSSQSFGTSATIRSRSPSRSPPDASTDAFSSSLTTTVFSQRSMRRLEASLRRATPKGHETFISRTAPHQGPAPTSSPPRVQDTPRHAHCRGAPQDAPNCAARSTCALTPNRPRVVQDPAHRAALPTQPACRHARRQHRQIRQGSAGHDWPDPLRRRQASPAKRRHEPHQCKASKGWGKECPSWSGRSESVPAYSFSRLCQ